MSTDLGASIAGWLGSGALGPLAPGLARTDMHAVLGDPDNWITHERETWQLSPGWMYGPVEVGLLDNVISYIQIDTCSIKHRPQNPRLHLDWDGLCDQMPVTECAQWLTERQLAFDFRSEEDGASLYLANSFLSFTGGDASTLVNVCSPGASEALRKARG